MKKIENAQYLLGFDQLNLLKEQGLFFKDFDEGQDKINWMLYQNFAHFKSTLRTKVLLRKGA